MGSFPAFFLLLSGCCLIRHSGSPTFPAKGPPQRPRGAALLPSGGDSEGHGWCDAQERPPPQGLGLRFPLGINRCALGPLFLVCGWCQGRHFCFHTTWHIHSVSWVGLLHGFCPPAFFCFSSPQHSLFPKNSPCPPMHGTHSIFMAQ